MTHKPSHLVYPLLIGPCTAVSRSQARRQKSMGELGEQYHQSLKSFCFRVSNLLERTSLSSSHSAPSRRRVRFLLVRRTCCLIDHTSLQHTDQGRQWARGRFTFVRRSLHTYSCQDPSSTLFSAPMVPRRVCQRHSGSYTRGHSPCQRPTLAAVLFLSHSCAAPG